MLKRAPNCVLGRSSGLNVPERQILPAALLDGLFEHPGEGSTTFFMKQLLVLIFLAGLVFGGCSGTDPIVVIQLHPTNPDILYIATNDYIYKTRDGGRTWTNFSKGMSYSRVIAMAIDPVYPATIYAGTKGDAVYKSYDGGQRWTSLRVGLDDATMSSVVNQFVFDPADAQHLFLATTMGVFESRNAGERWVMRMAGM
jgi:hypothetical protein